MTDLPYFIKHYITCIPGCETDVDCGGCPCHDHSPTCWPGRPDKACVCQQDQLIDQEDDQRRTSNSDPHSRSRINKLKDTR